jgi:pyruvate formate-lyase activating enzyme-like uncharacterized protein
MPARSHLPVLERHTQGLSPSCTSCAEGRKLVLFVTGVCDTGCFYCPLSDTRNHNPAMYANERLCLGRNEQELGDKLIEEARAQGATGAGITGGDPMLVPDLTIAMVGRLRDEFGDGFDMHLYTSKHPDRATLKRLRSAGLHEIRFHPHEKHWMRLRGSPFERALRDARSEGLRIAFEVPALPGAEAGLKALLDFAADLRVDFVNLNELEYTHTNGEELTRRNLRVERDGIAIAGSRKLALDLVQSYGKRLPMHYCSARFKDAVQLTNRVKRRAERTARPLDLVNEDGLLVLGVVETADPAALANRLFDEFDVPRELVAIDPLKSRVEVAAWVLEEICGEIEEKAFLVERYPTSEGLEVERSPLN